MITPEQINVEEGTLCWTCKWAAGKDGKCPWSREFKPVEGWEATPDRILITSATQTPDGVARYSETYTVHKCQLYELDPTVIEHKKMMAMLLEESRMEYKAEVEELEAEVERLWIVEHVDNAEIAERLDIPLWRLYKIRKKIKERYKNGK